MEENICIKNDPRRGKVPGIFIKDKRGNQMCSSSDNAIITALKYIANFCTEIFASMFLMINCSLSDFTSL